MKVLIAVRIVAAVLAVGCLMLSLVPATPLPERWRRASRYAALAAFGAQLAIELERIFGRRAPWTKVLFPIVGIAVVLESLVAGSLPFAAIAVSALIEAVVLATAAITAMRMMRRDRTMYPEDAFEDAIAAVAPRAVGAFMVAEATAFVAALRYLAGGFRRPAPIGHSYVRSWPMVPFLLALPVMVLPEMIVVDIVLANVSVSMWWRVANDVVHVYTILWSIGLVATARMRPHRIEGGTLRLRMGILGKLDAAVSDIAGSVVRRVVDDARALRRELGKETAVLAFDGAPALELTFHTPVRVRSIFGRERAVRRAVVAVDDPHAFAAALAQSAR